MIDWTKVEELKADIGPDDFDDIVEVFLDEVEEELGKLPAKGLSELESSLHFLKGSALNLGFSDFSALCQQGETASANGTPQSVDIPAILSSYSASKEIFLQGEVT